MESLILLAASASITDAISKASWLGLLVEGRTQPDRLLCQESSFPFVYH
jgi:hypothetical protein